MKKNTKIKIGLLFLICFGNCAIFMLFINNSCELNIDKNQSLKLNNNEINIITPEYKTYTKPMSGYYPATYGFENDGDGDDPEGWIIEEEFAGNIEVVSEIVGHKKVLKIPDYDDQRCILHQSFDDNQTNGTIEFWILSENVNERTTIHVGDENAGNVWEHSCSIWFARNGSIRLHNGSDFIWVYNQSLQPNEWYHLRIDFDCYDDWHLWINGEQLDSGGFAFRGSPTSMTQLRFGSQTTPTPIAYFDAIGYSWDPNYNIGDNLKEGLLLSFENTTKLDWMGYTLDDQTNKTILGNTTIPIPINGVHMIQVFGNDSLGNIYYSELRYFAIYYIGSPITIDGTTVYKNWFYTAHFFNWCSGTGTSIDPYIIKDIILEGQGEGIGILIENTREFFEIRNCYVSNFEIGLKIQNATDFKIFNTTVFNIKGSDGINGGPETSGGNGGAGIGISINNCNNLDISSNNISSIYGGKGGNGGHSSTHYGGYGGYGGDALGVIYINCINITNTRNNITLIAGGNGGNAGNSGTPLNYGDNGCNGRDGGNGGTSYGIYFKNCTNGLTRYTKSLEISGGNGGKGGNGGDGAGGIPGLEDDGNGGRGGKGGNGGSAYGECYENCYNIFSTFNLIKNVFGEDGGNGGEGGLPGNFAGGGHSGIGGNGGDGGYGFGIDIMNSVNITERLSNIEYIYHGAEGLAVWSGGSNGITGVSNGIFMSISNNNTIYGNIINNNENGIALSQSNYNFIKRNNVANSSEYGIFISASNNNTISENINHYNYASIKVDGSSNNKILKNSIYNNFDGLVLSNSDGNLVSDNVIYNNTNYGIYLNYGSTNNIIFKNILSANLDGIYITSSSFNSFSTNSILNNLVYGVLVATNSINNTFLNNSIKYNNLTGLLFDSTSSNNIVYLNNFTGNSINAIDEFANNQWDNGSVGNYWDDYMYFDLDGDGIGDAPYIIPSTIMVYNLDNYPIWGKPLPKLDVSIIYQSFSIETFNFTLYIYNCRDEGIPFATIQIWWNGAEVSSKVQNLGNGLYFISLNPITVAPGGTPILLNMTITANEYEEKYFEAYIAVDPDTLEKIPDGGKTAEEFPLITTIITITSIIGGIGIAGVTIILLRKRKRASEVR